MQMLATKSRVVSTTQHNQTQQQLVVKVEYIGRKNVFPTTGGIYLHVLEDRRSIYIISTQQTHMICHHLIIANEELKTYGD